MPYVRNDEEEFNMRKIVNEIIEPAKNKTISFSEPFYKSLNAKTIMGEVPFKEILFLEYRETEAGSNPREYIGLKKTNRLILHSLLTDSANMFRFLHSGIILCLTSDSSTKINALSIKYEECCLTNGNQTRFIILILTVMKLFFEDKEIAPIKSIEYNSFIKETFKDSEVVKSVLKYVKFGKVSEVITCIKQSNKYKTIFNNFDIHSFLDSRIRVQINIINTIIEDLEADLDAYSAGTLIAEANNDTQKVKPDDIFGNKYKKELQDYVFNDFINKNGKHIQIEYRYGEIADKSVGKVHILTLLRLIIPTGILKKDKDIYKLTNQRTPIYTIFSKLISKINKDDEKATATAKVVSKLIPLLYEIRENYVVPSLQNHKRQLIREYKKQAFAGELEDMIISQEIYEAKGSEEKIEKIVKGIVNYNIEHIMPVIVFRIRKLFKETNTHELILTIPEDLLEQYFTTISEVIYDSYVKMKLKGLRSSLTTAVRDRNFYEFGTEAHTTFKRMNKNIEETDFIEKSRYRID